MDLISGKRFPEEERVECRDRCPMVLLLISGGTGSGILVIGVPTHRPLVEKGNRSSALACGSALTGKHA
jgi:hypothetical protein